MPSPPQHAPVSVSQFSSRALGRKARAENIRVVGFIEDLLGSTYGPRGLDKLILDKENLVWITNDGGTVLSKIDSQHAVVQILAEVAQTMNKNAGDGATSAVLLACELLQKSVEIINLGVHPSIVVDAYSIGRDLASRVFRRMAIPAHGGDDESLLLKVASTTLASNLLYPWAPHLSRLAVEACLMVAKRPGEKRQVDLFDIHIEKAGGQILDSQLIEGFAFSHEIADDRMPKRVSPAKVATLAGEIGKPNLERNVFKHSVLVDSPKGLGHLIEERAKRFERIAEKIVSTGANVVLLEKGIDPLASYEFARRGVFLIRRIFIDDLDRLAKATGSRIISFHEDLRADDLGEAAVVEIRKFAGDDWLVVDRGEKARSATLLIRSVNERIGEEAERALKHAVSGVKGVLEEPHVITGGCSSEIEAALQLRRDSRELFGRHQMAVLRFADALEGMAEILGRSAGLDPLRVISQLRAAHTNGNPYVGIDVKERRIVDMRQIGVFHPLTIKEQILNSAVEAAILILRVGDVVLSNGCKHKDKAHDPDHNRRLHKDYKLESLEVEQEPTPKRN